ncbi:MAG: Lipoprotein signal peptidase [Verrucomicrobia subdivision 3 bacterium]|nr:Lipoprotein signal peptidase [Limisphaerales bacterium]MCS1414637.1 Lipoprotein signal peptidase [Limisphaerales bacterium]
MLANLRNPNLRIFSLCFLILTLDQISKFLVQRFLRLGEERVIIDGFFSLVYWGNTGAAWSMFQGSNTVLTIVAIIAVVALYLNRKHFEIHHPLGQVTIGLMLGGIIGNLIDRFRVKYVIDFIYFYTYQRGGGEVGFPAFNIADAAICTGVGLLLILSWRKEVPEPETNPVSAAPGS